MAKLNVNWKVKLTGDIYYFLSKFKTIFADFGKHLVDQSNSIRHKNAI